MTSTELEKLLQGALQARLGYLDEKHETAWRLYNGFTEGEPRLVADLYGCTLVIHNYADPVSDGSDLVQTAAAFYQEQLSWLKTVLLKTRCASDQNERQGILLVGDQPDDWIREHGVRYALALQMNQDAGFYLDTRGLRKWAIENLKGDRVLNTFAYTGSLGVAAMAGGAGRVVHTDLNRTFLNVAKRSYTLNGYPINRQDFLTGDFWSVVSRLKRSGAMFDCIFLDPPFFSTTDKGSLDLEKDTKRLINKVRPLVADDGCLVVVNNALFLSGQEFMDTVTGLCSDGYLKLDSLVPVPEDMCGFPGPRTGDDYPVDPAPFNHPTKMVVLRVKRKDGLK